MSKKMSVENYAQLGLPETVILGVQREFLGLTFVWWGREQWYKWRWNETHIDMGMLSIYGIKHPYLWYPLKWLIKPMRVFYHKKYVYRGNKW